MLITSGHKQLKCILFLIFIREKKIINEFYSVKGIIDAIHGNN